ncbi:MAG: carboxypeptidase regulatory-like domain-containing protein, partial [Acidobacteriia bacterium]|nr:carboxypeptidase regulatory-like domain-containing protein [Terriglobia bacterium]
MAASHQRQIASGRYHKDWCMLRFRRFLFTLTLAAGAVQLPAEVQSGLVRANGQPIPGAAVLVECGTEKIRTVTGPDGRFEVGGLPATPCQFSIGMFGFEQVQLEAKASATALAFELKLQPRASVPVEKSATRATAPPAATTPAPVPGSGPGRGARAAQGGTAGVGRGGFGGRGGTVAGSVPADPGRGGPGTGRGGAGTPPQGAGFQNLSLVQNGEALSSDVENTAAIANLADMSAGASEALLVNGSLSQAVQTQSGDGMGMGGPMGFGPGGPGGFGGPGGQDGFGGFGGPGGQDGL